MKGLMVGCLGLAVLAAVVYFLMGAGIISVPDVGTEDAPAAIVYVAGACYILGGLLIFTQKRGLWIAGAAINALVIVIFFAMYNQKPDIMLSMPGLLTKIAQVVLEVGLVALIVSWKSKKLQTAY